MSNLKGNKSNLLKMSQKLELVRKHFEEQYTYRELAVEYEISYSTARTLCLKYKKFGKEGLVSKTGKYIRKLKFNADKGK